MLNAVQTHHAVYITQYFINRAATIKKNYIAACEENQKVRQQNVTAEKERRQAQLLAARCLAKEDNVNQLKKELCTINREKEELSATLERETKRYVECSVNTACYLHCTHKKTCACRSASRNTNYLQALEEKKSFQEKTKQKEQQLRREVNEILRECDQLRQQNLDLADSNNNLTKIQSDLLEMQGHVKQVEGERDRIQGERDLLRKQNEELHLDFTKLKRTIDNVSAGNNAVDVSRILGVSPKSMKKVEKYSNVKGDLSFRGCGDAASPPEAERDYTLERIERALTPAMNKLCSIPKFDCGGDNPDGVSDVQRVAKSMLRKLARRKPGQGKAKRKLFKGNRRPQGISNDLDSLLKEMATAWRSATRSFERDAAARLLQMTLLAIPRRRGRVFEWLGPHYFDEELPVELGSAIRYLGTKDPAKFRNDYRNSSLGNTP